MSSAARVRYEFSLDTPLPVRATDGVIRLKGWCFTPFGPSAPLIQLRVGALILSTEIGTERADVAAAFPDVPHARQCGFELSGHIPAGLSVAELWAGRDGFSWEPLLSFSVYAEAAVLHGAIDLPLDKTILTNRTIDGWCFHPQREIAELWLHYGNRQVRCRHYGHARTDVGAQFPHLPQASLCGFSSEDVLQPGEGRVRLRAVDRQGGVYFCETDHVIRLLPAQTGHAHSDPRLDGRALYRACSSRQATLPALRIVVSSPTVETMEAVAAALLTLPGDQWQIVGLTDNASPATALNALVARDARLVVQSAPLTPSSAWTLLLQPGELPDIHGVMAAWLTAADHPELAAIYGDYTAGAERTLHIQPPWSPALALAGGIAASTPLLYAPHRDADSASLIALAETAAAVVHIAASLTHRPASTLTPDAPARAALAPNLAAPANTTAIVLGDDTALATARAASTENISEWIATGATITPATLNAAVQRARGELLFFVTSDTRYLSSQPVAALAAELTRAPRTAIVPLLVDAELAPWMSAAPRTRAMLASFDPAYAFWIDPRLALFTRQIAYLALPGLLIARERFLALGGFDATFDSLAGALLDFSFKLRRDGTPPVLAAHVRLQATPPDDALSSFEETLLLDRWDQDDANPLRIRPLVPVEVLA